MQEEEENDDVIEFFVAYVSDMRKRKTKNATR
jgi:hypothetical protein